MRLLALGLLWDFVGADSPQDLEIMFEPFRTISNGRLDIFQDDPEFGLRTNPKSLHKREAALDDMLSSLFQDKAESGLGAIGDRDGMRIQKEHSAFPAEILRDLFPGPWMAGQTHPVAFAEPDPFVQDLMKDFNREFVGLMNEMQVTDRRDRLPHSCNQDIAAWCQGASSQLHCLGQHVDDISSACQGDVGKSIPFRCSSSIHSFCNSRSTGILDCLGTRIAELPESCRDAVLATHHVISKAATHKVAIVDKADGTRREVLPSVNVSPPKQLLGAPHPAAVPSELPTGMAELLGVGSFHSLDRVRGHPWQTLCILTLVVAAVASYMAPGAGYDKFQALLVSLAGSEKKEFTSDVELSTAVDAGFVSWP